MSGLNNKKRVTITLDEKVIWMLRNKQSEMMLDENSPVSFSYVINTLFQKMIRDQTMRNENLDSIFTFHSKPITIEPHRID